MKKSQLSLNPVVLPGLLLASCHLVQAQPASSGVMKPAPTAAPTTTETYQSDTGTMGAQAVTAQDDYEPQVEIHGYLTPGDTSDDIMEVNGTNGSSIRLSNPIGQDVTVVLTNPDNHLMFVGGNAQNQLTLTLPGDGSPVFFTVQGTVKTTTFGGAKVNVHVNYDNQPTILSFPFTVFYFGQAAMSVQSGDTYVIDSQPTNQTGVRAWSIRPGHGSGIGAYLNARAAVLPVGVSPTAPQVAKYRVGIIQNVWNFDGQMNFSNPIAISYPIDGVTPPAKLTVAKTYTVLDQDARRLLDADTSGTLDYAPPLYGLNSDYVKYLNQTVSQTDSPSINAYGDGLDPWFYARDSSGNPVGAYTYNTVSGSLAAQFTDYCVVFNTVTRDGDVFRNASWRLFATKTPGYPATAYSDSPYDGNLVADGDLANAVAHPVGTRSTTTVTINNVN